MANNLDEYSEKSVKNDENRFFNFVDNLSPDQLEILRADFENRKKLNRDEFVNLIHSLYPDENIENDQILAIFQKHTSITWSDFLDFLVATFERRTPQALSLIFKNIIPVAHTKKETIVKIVLIETAKYFCYALISKFGRVGIYDGNMNFLTTYHLIMTREDISRREEDRRRRNRWVTDAVFCQDVLMFIVTNSARSIVIYEASSLKHVPLFIILSTPNVVECLAYKKSPSKEVPESILFMGDSTGSILSFNFAKPRTGLFRKKHNDKISLFYWGELSEEKEFITVKRYGRLHKENVCHLKYCEDNGTLISSSKDPNAAIVINAISHKNKNKPYIFQMKRGCNCFALSRQLKILITGSDDGVLRLWNPIIPAKALSVLKACETALVDVQIMEKERYFLSCSAKGIIKLWDINEEKCLQSLSLPFPSFNILGKLIEWGIECIYPGPKRNSENNNVWQRSHILVVCCNHIGKIGLKFEDKGISETFEQQVLPPPPLLNSVLVPKSWETSDTGSIELNNPDKEAKNPDAVLIQERLQDFNFILERDLFKDMLGRSDINLKIAELERKKIMMHEHVARGGQFIALDLYDIKPLQLSPNLPVPNRKKIKATVAKIEKILQDASARDEIFSQPSSSRSPRSSRSSVVEFEY